MARRWSTCTSCQGERELAKDSRSLARFELRGIDPDAGRHAEDRGHVPDRRQRHPAGAGQEQRTGKAASIEVKPTYGSARATSSG
jgi:molecular chaperone DnaK (HSP70)